MSHVGIGNVLGAPDADFIVEGLNALPFWYSNGASVALNIQPNDLYGVDDIALNAPKFDKTAKVFQVGGGNNPRESRSQYNYDGTLKMLAGAVNDLQALVLGKTFGSGGQYAFQGRMPTISLGTLVISFQTDDGTVLWQTVYQDLGFKEFGRSVSLNENKVDIPIFSQHDWFDVEKGGRVFFDKFTSDGILTDFVLSATPEITVDATDRARDDWPQKELIFVKLKKTGEDEGTRILSGITVDTVTKTVTFATAPAAGEVEIMAIKAA